MFSGRFTDPFIQLPVSSFFGVFDWFAAYDIFNFIYVCRILSWLWPCLYVAMIYIIPIVHVYSLFILIRLMSSISHISFHWWKYSQKYNKGDVHCY